MSDRMKLMKQIQGQTTTHECPECGTPTYCAVEDGKSGNLCWCMQEPKLERQSDTPDVCLCRKCLTQDSH